MSVETDRLAAESAQYLRKGHRGTAGAVVDHDLETGFPDLGHIEAGTEVFGVLFDGTAGEVDMADLVHQGPSELFSEKRVFDLSLHGSADVHAALVEELKLKISDVVLGDPAVDAADRLGGSQDETAQWGRGDTQVMHAHPHRNEPTDQSAVDHPRGGMVVASECDGRVFAEKRAVSRTELESKLRSDLNVAETGNTFSAKHRFRPLLSPHDRE